MIIPPLKPNFLATKAAGVAITKYPPKYAACNKPEVAFVMPN